ncbi:hypothetical protein L6452_34839 [Arctium lappa]|uniref:Uncharacterized protein n=1 Tax=Arctium lappa TaxID=4217 RepID=A0ACB8YKI3_ARCLA|nr:hypothetical protein L6452_34839 [Arctium lappa]
MYGIYYDLPLDYAGLIFREIQNAVITKQQHQDRGTEPKNIAFGRFLGLLLGDDLIREGKLPAEGDVAIYLRDEGEKVTEVEAAEAQVSERERPLVRGEGSEKNKKKKSKKKRTEDVEVPMSSKKSKRTTEEEVPKEKAKEETAEIRVPEKKKRKLRMLADKEQYVETIRSRRKDLVEDLVTRTEPAKGKKKPLQKAKRALVLEESPEDKPQSLGETVAMEIEDVTEKSQSEEEEHKERGKLVEERVTKDAFGTPPKPTPSPTYTSTPAVLVERGIETGPHSPNQTLADQTKDIPSSSVPPSGETKSTSPSQKGESAVLRVHSPQDTTLPHTEDPFNIDRKGVSEPSPKERVDRTSIDASSMEHRGLEGNTPELNISTCSESAKDSSAKSGTFVVPEDTLDIYLKSSVTRESQAHSEFLAEALKANTDALNALPQSSQQHLAGINELRTNCAKRVDLQACGQSIIAHSKQIQALGDLCTDEFPKYAT